MYAEFFDHMIQYCTCFDYICYGSYTSTVIDEYKPVSNTVNFKTFINLSGLIKVFVSDTWVSALFNLTELVVPTVRGWEKYMVTYFGGLVDTRITNYFSLFTLPYLIWK